MILKSVYVLKTDNTTLPFTTTEVNDHLKESFSDIADEAYLKVLIHAVKEFFERRTGRIVLNKTFTNYRRDWDYEYELRRSKLQSISSVKYIDDAGDTQTVSTDDYKTTFNDDFSSLYFDESYSFPTLSSNHAQSVIIEFIAGYGSTASNIPEMVKTAMLHHLARLWKNRGDCSQNNINGWIEKNIPPASLLIYDMERIIDIV